MELNLAPVSGTFKPKPPVEKAKVKGSWKKRRRVQVLNRIKEQRKRNPLNRNPQKSQARSIQADEFSSGIERTGADISEKKTDDEPNPKRRRKHIDTRRTSSSANEDATEITVRPEGKKVSKRPRSVPLARESKGTTPFDQTPEAVQSALNVLGSGNYATGNDVEESKSDAIREERPEVHEKTDATPSFESLGLYHSVSNHLTARMQITEPTQIQELVLKTMLNADSGRQAIDILVRSATGSGKTLSYLLPIAHYMLNRPKRVSRQDGSLGIIIVPTRELADQVHEVARMLFRLWHWIVVGAVIGGESKRREKARIRKGINVLVATPGRLLDHMRNTRSFAYGFCEFLVLDEADRLLDLGFEADVKEIIHNLNNQANISNPNAGKVRSNILLSATLSNDVERLAEYSLENPVELVAKANNLSGGKKKFAMPEALRQHYCIVEQKYRLITLACFIRLRAMKDGRDGSDEEEREENKPPCKVIVFFSTCDSVDFHYNLLKQVKLPPELRSSEYKSNKLIPLDLFRIHGNHAHGDRVSALRSFRKSRRAVLLCTDVAARGLDLKDLTFAIQYDPPTGGQGEELEYMHRAGRTARHGAKGDALLFLLPSEKAYVNKLRSTGVTISEISGSAALAAMYPKANLSNEAGISYATRLVTSAIQEAFDSVVNDNEELKHEAVAGYQSYCRAYATHAKEVKYFFHVRNLHLGHVARAFVLSDKPGEFAELMADIKKEKGKESTVDSMERRRGGNDKRIPEKADIARARAEGEQQPFNNQRTELAKRRREKGRGQEAMKEMALEFAA